MRWLSPPDRVPELRDRVRYSKPTLTRKPRRSLISLSMRWAISRCCGLRVSATAANQTAAWAIDMRETSPMWRLSILTARASGLRRKPSQSSQGAAS